MANVPEPPNSKREDLNMDKAYSSFKPTEEDHAFADSIAHLPPNEIIEKLHAKFDSHENEIPSETDLLDLLEKMDAEPEDPNDPRIKILLEREEELKRRNQSIPKD